ncbi:DNA sulfur modification protein DndD [bacterium]|nr:DNA sulfur modification protein DndD [bacterium]
MIIRKLTLNDFGVFAGQQELDLSPRGYQGGRQNPIILFGGMNGSGKTTILEAVRLCLYGRASLTKKVSNKEYQEYLRGLIHRYPPFALNSSSAAIKLEFEYGNGEGAELFVIERLWLDNGEGIDETLKVYRNGCLLSELEADYWQDFVQDLIPQGIAQLFFFDGEHIQQLAYGEKGDTRLAESINNLLGLDLVDRLQADLNIYVRRQKKSSEEGEIQKQILNLESRKNELEAKLRELEQVLASKKMEIDELTSQIALLEQRLSQRGGLWIKDREALHEQKARLSQAIETVRNQIREQCAGLYPFSLIPELCLQVSEQLVNEGHHRHWDALHRQLGTIAEKVASQTKLYISKLPGAPKPLASKIAEFVKTSITNQDSPEGSADIQLIHDLSPSLQTELMSMLTQIIGDVPEGMKTLSSAMERSIRDLEKIERKIQRIPPEEAVKPIIDDLSEANKLLGSFQSETSALGVQISSLKFQIQETLRGMKKLYDRLDEREDIADRISLANKVGGVLTEFISQVRRKKLRELEQCFSSIFNNLARKEDVLSEVKIHQEDFSVTLYNRHAVQIAKNQLSAGEKQIYAISLLWALSKVSGRPLPVMIDTPLGRLDSDHRRHIVENYFPRASHQVIILSTDTEIDQHYFEVLTPEISHAYHLEYNNKDGSTSIKEGYFWEHKEVVKCG